MLKLSIKLSASSLDNKHNCVKSAGQFRRNKDKQCPSFRQYSTNNRFKVDEFHRHWGFHDIADWCVCASDNVVSFV
ncbi:unnamed protein product [Heterobilharzia americana]|nr:unnamed protein product [Heterobilharzia americana]